ncbi:P-loop containing nucleoside triphosphate hydrolase protein [Rhizophagus clarus]|uniref:P-loop containing nucleoside triphosphate hydrolase protein n=1 Tax=Rhizophagus clarus TaxID=94130 RepID=A0A8H3LBC1_9GLOM|nr:P-loop containing nucleoside triphosphate hydrolase protein [Rhizophagus clarus]
MDFLKFIDEYKKRFPNATPELVNEAFKISNEHPDEHPVLGKREFSEEFSTLPNKKKFSVNSTIMPWERKNVYFVDPAENNKKLIELICEGEYVLLHGPRASGKSTRALRAIDQLEERGYFCIYFAFSYLSDNVERFWTTCARGIRRELVKKYNDRVNNLRKAKHCNIPFMENLDDIFDILYLHPDSTMSATRSYLTFVLLKPDLQQVEFIFKDFMNDRDLKIDDRIIDDIYKSTNGHAGLVNLCGRVVDAISGEYSEWILYKINNLGMEISNYATFMRLIKSLKSDDARDAMNLLRTRFLGSLDTEEITDCNELSLVRFLISEGVLIYEGDFRNSKTFRMSSPFIDLLIRRYVIPDLYPSYPLNKAPLRGDYKLDTLRILETALSYFDKDIIQMGSSRSFKIAPGRVNGKTKARVPRESIYENELYRVLVNWLCKEGAEVTAQWHLKINSNDKYCDIVVRKHDQVILLELLATPTKGQLDEHYDRVLIYAESLSATETWIVNFTCEDGVELCPHWPSLDSGVQAVLFKHDLNFTKVQMVTHTWDTTGKSYATSVKEI